MANPFIAEIRMFGFNFVPRGWAWCNGQILPISQNTALFSLLGTTYGGNGRTNFALPDLQGRAALGQGSGPGLTSYTQGQAGGQNAVTLLQSEIPSHSHSLVGQPGVPAPAPSLTPASNIWGVSGSRRSVSATYASAQGTPVAMSVAALGNTGGNQGHNNMSPYLTLYFAIALIGDFPPRS